MNSTSFTEKHGTHGNKTTVMISSLLMVAAIMIAGTPAEAEEEKLSKDVAALERFFKNMDTNANGQLSQEEFLGFWMRYHDKLDRNEDGVLDQTELLSASYFQAMDTNKDGVVDRQEHALMRKKHWNRHDLTVNNWVSLDEFIRRSRGRGVRSEYDTVTTFTKMDVNGDGSLTEAEYLAFWETYFKNRDANNDKVLSRQEHNHADSFNSFDQNRNGQIEPGEDRLLRAKDFKALDKDGDGSLSQPEFVR